MSVYLILETLIEYMFQPSYHKQRSLAPLVWRTKLALGLRSHAKASTAESQDRDYSALFAWRKGKVPIFTFPFLHEKLSLYAQKPQGVLLSGSLDGAN